jgi:hypothetical protein
MESWNRQILQHVNNDVNIYQDGNVVGSGVRIINIDLEHGRIVARKDKGEGPQITVWGGSIVIVDLENYRPGKSEYEMMHGITKSPEEVLNYY